MPHAIHSIKPEFCTVPGLEWTTNMFSRHTTLTTLKQQSSLLAQQIMTVTRSLAPETAIMIKLKEKAKLRWTKPILRKTTK